MINENNLHVCSGVQSSKMKFEPETQSERITNTKYIYPIIYQRIFESILRCKKHL